MQGGGIGHFDSRIVNPALTCISPACDVSFWQKQVAPWPVQTQRRRGVGHTFIKRKSLALRRGLFWYHYKAHTRRSASMNFEKKTEPKVCPWKGEMLWKRQRLPRAKYCRKSVDVLSCTMMCSAGSMWDSKSEGQSTSSTSTTELTESREAQQSWEQNMLTHLVKWHFIFAFWKTLSTSYRCQDERPSSNKASNRGRSWRFNTRSKQEQQGSGLVRFVPCSEVPQATRPRRPRQLRLEAESKWIKGSASAALAALAAYRCVQWVYRYPFSAPRWQWFYTINTISCININVNVNHKFWFNFNFWEWRFSTCTCIA